MLDLHRVLSEGLNLQDATRLINYDLHWNPVRLMQRIGRVDRRMNPDIEAASSPTTPTKLRCAARSPTGTSCRPTNSTASSPSTAGSPQDPPDLQALRHRGPQAAADQDDYDDLKDFNAAYEGTTSPEETLRLELADLLRNDPALPPGWTFSRTASSPAARPSCHRHLFCWSLPVSRALPTSPATPTLGPPAPATSAGTSAMPPPEDVEPSAIAALIRPDAATPRHLATPRPALAEARDAVEKHIRNGYLKQIRRPPASSRSSKPGWTELMPAKPSLDDSRTFPA